MGESEFSFKNCGSECERLAGSASGKTEARLELSKGGEMAACLYSTITSFIHG